MKDESLESFLAAVAAPKPTPGGGSVSALAGALAVALTRMVAGLALDKPGYEAAQADLHRIESEGKDLQGRLMALVAEDAAAYEAVLAAMHRPRTTDAEKAARVEAMQAAYRRATEVPLETIEKCVRALRLAETAAEKGNRSATTDAGVAVVLAEAAIRGASLNCRVNLASIKDETFRQRIEGKLEGLLREAHEIGHRAMALVEGRL